MNRPKCSQKIMRGLVQLLGMSNVPAANLSADAGRARQWVDQMTHWFSVRVPKRSRARRPHGLGTKKKKKVRRRYRGGVPSGIRPLPRR